MGTPSSGMRSPGVYAFAPGVTSASYFECPEHSAESPTAIESDQFEIGEFVIGEDNLEYGYVWSNGLFLAARDLQRVGDLGTSEGAPRRMRVLFREIDTSGDGEIQWEEITSFVGEAEILCDLGEMRRDFVQADSRAIGKLSLDDLIAAYRTGLLSPIFRMPAFSSTTGMKFVTIDASTVAPEGSEQMYSLLQADLQRIQQSYDKQ